MRLKMRHLVAALSVAAAVTVGNVASAQDHADFPSREITIIVPRAPGGGSDNLTRLLAPALEEILGVPVVVENRPDASAVLGAQLVAHAKPDGYTLYLADNAFYQNPAVIGNLPYDVVEDFSSVTMLARSPVILVVHPSVPAKTAKELVEYAKSRPGELTYSTGGIGTSTHLAGVQFNMSAGTDIIHVPYKSSGPALNALLGNHVTMQFGGINSSKPHIEAGSIRAIGVTGDKRSPSMPDVPTLEEAGVSGVTITSLWGVHAPAGTPIEIRRKLRDAFVEAMNDPKVKKRMADLGYQIAGTTPEEHQRETEELVSYWLEVAEHTDLSK